MPEVTNSWFFCRHLFVGHRYTLSSTFCLHKCRFVRISYYPADCAPSIAKPQNCLWTEKLSIAKTQFERIFLFSGNTRFYQAERRLYRLRHLTATTKVSKKGHLPTNNTWDTFRISHTFSFELFSLQNVAGASQGFAGEIVGGVDFLYAYSGNTLASCSSIDQFTYHLEKLSGWYLSTDFKQLETV